MPDDTTERWRSVPDWEDVYEVSDRGDPTHRCAQRRALAPGRITTGSATRQGYRQAFLSYHGEWHSALLHRLVLAAFAGPCPDGYEVNHKNGDKADNRLLNLEYITPSANTKHAAETGLHVYAQGDAHHRTRYPDALVEEWRRRYAGRESADAIARAYGLDRSRVWEIVTGKRRRHSG